MSLIISVSGLRGIVGESLTPDVVQHYVAAFEALLPAGTIVVGHDGRATGPEFSRHVAATLAARGRTVLDARACATPTMGVLVQSRQAAAGIQVSASHNPPEYNGLKLFGSDGRVLPANEGERVKARFLKREDRVTTSAPGRVEEILDTTSDHWNRIRPLLDLGQIRGCGFRVLLDSNHGAGSVAGRRVLDEMGCDVIQVGGTPDGKFAHPPEPTRENLKSVVGRVAHDGAAVGFCQDPDADRLALIDELGRYVGEEYTLAVVVNHWLQRHVGPVVTNCSTSRMTRDLAAKFEVPFFQSAVGEANVVDQMLAVGAVIGGEGNGGVIHPRVVLVRDSMVGMALVLDAMADRNVPLSRLVDELPRYEMYKTKVHLPTSRVAEGLELLERHFTQAVADRLDGLRLDWSDRWLLVRASNTEPIVRVIAEAPTPSDAQALCDEAGKVLMKLG